MNHSTMWRAGLVDCMLCYAGAKGRRASKGHFGFRGTGSSITRETWYMALQRRSQEARDGVAAASPVPSSGYWSKLPTLCEWLSALTWEDGSRRLTGTIMVFGEDGRWKAWLHDRDAAMGCFVSSDTLEGALQAAEKAVGSSGGDWRPDKSRKVK
jgi:hypothetical protein